jgi:hypothetical protein
LATRHENQNDGARAETLERNERPREDRREEVILLSTWQGKNLKDQPKGKDQRGSEETDTVASLVKQKL